MEGIPNSVIDFFNRYPDADEVFEVAEQLFHANAKDAAEARANFYGKEIKTYKQSDVFAEPEISEELLALKAALEAAADAEIKAKKIAETTEGSSDEPKIKKSKGKK